MVHKKYSKKYHRKSLGLVLILIGIFSSGFISLYLYLKPFYPTAFKFIYPKIEIQDNQNAYAGFLSEIYDKIKDNYWDKISDEDLSTIFKLGSERLTKNPQNLESKDKKGVQLMVGGILNDLEQDKKNEFTVKLADIVLINLKPQARSRLYTTKQKKNLENLVQNIDLEANLYKVLEIDKDASQKEIDKSYREKVAKLSEDKLPEAKEELTKIKRAYSALSEPEKRKKYDKSGAEPTVISKLIRPGIFYLHIKRFSPTTLDEFVKAVNAVEDKPGLDSFILDLRGNIGGAIDILQYFLGPFIGKDQYAYEFFHQGEREVFKTKSGWLNSLVKYKKVVILVDGKTQSSAEVMATTLKKYNVGIVVGTQTKGWGTVEQILSIDSQIDENEKYSILLVHSVTLRNDGQPIEGNGVNPVINIDDSDWKKQLFAYFHYDKLIQVVEELVNQ